jgi:hypothetical protein
MLTEVTLLLKGLPWGWLAVAGGLLIIPLFVSAEVSRSCVLPAAWLWPVLVWSGLGNGESRHNTQQMVFSAAAPLTRQLPATRLGGFGITLLTGSGVALRLLIAGDGAGLLAWLSGAVFIPSYALALGVWSGGKNLFEMLYISLWYLALNKVVVVDFLGANSDGNFGLFIPLSLALLIITVIGRARRLANVR